MRTLRKVAIDPFGAASISDTAVVQPGATIGPGSTVLSDVLVGEYSLIGSGCLLGRGSYVGPGVVIGKNCHIENAALLYEPSLLEDGVFIGPGVIFTNDKYPRAVTSDGTRKAPDGLRPAGVTVRSGASIGAGAVCIAPITIGRWACVAAGAVVTRDVPDYAVVAGVPARQVGWVGRAGTRLEQVGDGILACPVSGERYRTHGGTLSLIVEER